MEDMLALVILSAVGLHQTMARLSRHLGGMDLVTPWIMDLPLFPGCNRGR